MIQVFLSRANLAEKKYIVKTLMSYFENLDFSFSIHSEPEYRFRFENGKEIIFQDHFFAEENESYLQLKNIPTQALFVHNIFIPEKDLPVLYGNDEFFLTDSSVLCGADIFASAFYMLARWEESVSTKRDKFGRFPDSEAFVVKHGLHYRPIVNEYLEMLRRMIVYLGIPAHIARHFTVKPTHDVDFLFRNDTFGKMLKSSLGDLIKRFSPLSSVKSVLNYFGQKAGLARDSYDTFDFLLENSIRHGLHPVFYFIPSLSGEAEAKYSIENPKLSEIIRKILENGFQIGIHGSLRASETTDTFLEEKDRLEQIAGLITEVRMHFLRIAVPRSFVIFEKAKILTDSSLGYSFDSGFRCGICFEFAVFDVRNRRETGVCEMPLIVMETSLRKKYPEIGLFKKKFLELAETVKKYDGEFVFLWHNSNLKTGIWKNGEKIYAELISEITR